MKRERGERKTSAKHTFLVLASQQSGAPETLANTWWLCGEGRVQSRRRGAVQIDRRQKKLRIVQL